jgi:hypothetical protein
MLIDRAGDGARWHFLIASLDWPSDTDPRLSLQILVMFQQESQDIV